MKKALLFSIIASVFVVIVGACCSGNASQTCHLDSTFNRVECCTHITADGNCAVGQDVIIYNI